MKPLVSPNLKNLYKSVNLTDSIYHATYHSIIKISSQLKDDPNGDAVVALSTMVYGWMPTILKSINLDLFSPDKRKILSSIRSIDSFESSIAYLDELKSGPPINNSWVGTSKFLHFVNPEYFAIWDSRVAKHWGITTKYSIEKIDNYVRYLKFVSEHINDETVFNAQSNIKNKFGYNPSNTRCLELILFLASKNI